MLQWMPSFSRISAAWMPSQVEASFHEHAVTGDAGLIVLRAMMSWAWSMRLLGVIGEAGVNFGRDATGDDVEDLEAEGDRERLEGDQRRLLCRRRWGLRLWPALSTSSTMDCVLGHLQRRRRSGRGWWCCPAGLNCLMELKSPLSATTVVIPRSCSSNVCAMVLLLGCCFRILIVWL